MTRSRTGQGGGVATVVGRGLALALALAVAGCGVTRDHQAREIARQDIPFNLADPTTTTTVETTVPTSIATSAPTTSTTEAVATTTAPTEPVLLFFVRGDRLVTEVRSLPLSDSARIGLNTALDQLVVGPNSVPAGVQTLVTSGVLNSLEVVAGTARVGLGTNYFALSPQQQVLALGQVVLTLTDRPGVGRVQFTLNGAPADVFRGDVSITSTEVSADDYRVLLGP